MSDKQLRFSFTLDEASFAKVKRAISDLTSEMAKFAKASQGSGMGGLFTGANIGKTGTPGQNQVGANYKAQGTQNVMSKMILENADAFRKMSNMGKESLKGLTD